METPTASSSTTSSLNDCVDHFIACHSKTLLAPHSNDNDRPKLSRFNSNPIAIYEFEKEDPNLFVITPPIEHFLRVPCRIRRDEFFKLIRTGHLLIGNVLAASARDMVLRLLCFDDGHRRAIHDLKLTATCLLTSSSSKYQQHSYHRRQSRYERDAEERSDEEKEDAEYQSGDLVRACVIHVDTHKEEIQLSIDSSSMRRTNSSKRLGLINQDDLPTHYTLLRKQEEHTQTYDRVLQSTKSFCNRACVQTLYQRLKQRFQEFQPESSHSDSSTTNHILSMTLINSFKTKHIPSEEYFDKLRLKQDQDWAMDSVAAGIRLMKDDQAGTAVLHFNKALSTDPTCVDAFVARGALSANQGHFKRAMKDFDDALRIDRHHKNAQKYMHDVLISIAKVTDEHDEAIHYYEKALKYKPDDHEAKRQLDIIHTKKREAARKLEYGPSLPSNHSRQSRWKLESRSSDRPSSSIRCASSTSSCDNGSKRKRSRSPNSQSYSRRSHRSRTSSSSSSSTSSSSTSSSSSSSPLSCSSSPSTRPSETNKSNQSILVVDLTENSSSMLSEKMKKSDDSHTVTMPSTLIDNKRRNGNSLVSDRSRFYSNPSSTSLNTSSEQRRSCPTTSIDSVSSKSASKKTSNTIDREAEDIERLYEQLKAKHSMEKRKH